MICIKTDIKHMPEYCDECAWYECRPHPMKGWSDGCGLMMQCMDDDQPEEWIYDGNGRPKACPLIKVEDEPQAECEITDCDYHDACKKRGQTDCQWK